MNSKTIFNGKIVTLSVDETILPNGLKYSQEIVHHPGGACAVPIFDNGDILLLRQFRYAAGGYIWEIPAGKLDIKNEAPRDCAARELIEEAGYEAEHIEKILDFFTTPGFCDEVLHIFKATGLKPVERNTEEHEVIEVHRFSKGDISSMISKGEIRDGKTLVGLYACGFGPH